MLILSEFAGAAQCLSGALRCNPWSQSDVADTIYAALSMSREERIMRHKVNDYYVTKYSSSAWAMSFIENAKKCTTAVRQSQFVATDAQAHATTLSTLPYGNAVRDYSIAQSRCIILTFEECMLRTQVTDYSDTETRTAGEPRLSVPPALLNAVKVLAADPHNTVIIVSSLSSGQMKELFPIPRVFLIAEGGCLVSFPSREEYNISAMDKRSEWLREILAIDLPQVQLDDESVSRHTSVMSLDSFHEKDPHMSFLSGDLNAIEQFSQSVGLQSESNIPHLLSQQHYGIGSPTKGIQSDAFSSTHTDGFRVRVREYYSNIPLAKFHPALASGEQSMSERSATVISADEFTELCKQEETIQPNAGEAAFQELSDQMGGFYSVDAGIEGAPVHQLHASRERLWNQYSLSSAAFLGNTDLLKGTTVISFDSIRRQLESALHNSHGVPKVPLDVSWQEEVIQDLERFVQQTPEIKFISSENQAFLDFSNVDADIAELQLQAILEYIHTRSYSIPLDVVPVTDTSKRGVLFRPRNGTIDRCLIHIFDYVLSQRMKSEGTKGLGQNGLFDYLVVFSDQFDSLGVLTSLSSLLLQSIGLEALLGSDPTYEDKERALLNLARLTRKETVVYKTSVLLSPPHTWNKPMQIRRYENLRQSNTIEFEIEGTTKVRNLLCKFACISQSNLQQQS